MHGRTLTGQYRDSWDEAERDLRELGKAKRIDGSVTVETYARHILDTTLKTEYKRDTWKTAYSLSKTYIHGSRLARVPVGSADRRDVQVFLDSMESSPSTQRRLGGWIGRIFKEAVKDGYIESSPVKDIQYRKSVRRNSVVLTRAELVHFREPAGVYAQTFAFMLYTGLRRGEAVGLRWMDVRDGAVYPVAAKTEESETPVPLNRVARAVVDSRPRIGQYVFCNSDGSKIDPDTLSHKWRDFRSEKGIDARVRLHDLRGTFITLLIDAGENPKTVQRLARHKSIETTLGIYARSVDKTVRDAVETISDICG